MRDDGDDGKGKTVRSKAGSTSTVAQTLGAIRGTQATLEHLWAALFTQVATDAGLPLPEMSLLGMASFKEEGHAEALASHLTALGVKAMRFKTSADTETPFCVSLNL